jgi:flagellar hook-associated protein 1 FlgK
MPGLFQALEIGKRALLTHQVSLQTAGHNIANVNTPGYTRQRVNINSSLPEWTTNGIIGSGVQVDSILHIRDLFLGEQYRQDAKSLGQWQYKGKLMTEIESLFSEPNDNTLSHALNKFWDSWSDLSTNPNSISSRVAIVEQANLMVNSFHDLSTRLDSLQSSIDRDLVGYTDEINRLTTEIASINKLTRTVELGGTQANDLRDSRDSLIDQLARYIDVTTNDCGNGETNVMIGAMILVDGGDVIEISADAVNVDGELKHALNWKGTTVQLKNSDGELKGLFDSRDITIPHYKDQLDDLARTLIEQVNELHRTGYGVDGVNGRNLFDTTYMTAASMRLSSSIVSDPSRIAASGSGEIGDNTIALAMHDLRKQTVMSSDSSTMNDFYNSLIGKLGIETREAQTSSDSYTMLLEQVEQARQSVQGVSLDEEMTNMIRHQHAYDAAARVITTMDQALDTVITRMGIVGR